MDRMVYQDAYPLSYTPKAHHLFYVVKNEFASTQNETLTANPIIEFSFYAFTLLGWLVFTFLNIFFILVTLYLLLNNRKRRGSLFKFDDDNDNSGCHGGSRSGRSSSGGGGGGGSSSSSTEYNNVKNRNGVISNQFQDDYENIRNYSEETEFDEFGRGKTYLNHLVQNVFHWISVFLMFGLYIPLRHLIFLMTFLFHQRNPLLQVWEGNSLEIVRILIRDLASAIIFLEMINCVVRISKSTTQLLFSQSKISKISNKMSSDYLYDQQNGGEIGLKSEVLLLFIFGIGAIYNAVVSLTRSYLKFSKLLTSHKEDGGDLLDTFLFLSPTVYCAIVICLNCVALIVGRNRIITLRRSLFSLKPFRVLCMMMLIAIIYLVLYTLVFIIDKANISNIDIEQGISHLLFPIFNQSAEILIFFILMLWLNIRGIRNFLVGGVRLLDKFDDDKMLSLITSDYLERNNVLRFIDSYNITRIEFFDMKELCEIGSGGSGTVVYRAMWKHQKVAVKLFNINAIVKSNDSIEAILQQFSQEVGTLSALNHPNIISFFGIVMEKSRVGIVMEYCSNGDLASVIEQEFLPMRCSLRLYHSTEPSPNGTSLPPIHEMVFNLKMIKKLEILLHISKGMQYLHGRNMIHRDLKTENILIDENFVAKIIDFGLTRSIMENQNRNMTRQVGTLSYIAPEVYDNIYDNKCDVYSYGMIMYQVLFEKIELYENIGTAQKAAIDANHRPKIPEFSDGFVLKMSTFEDASTLNQEIGPIVQKYVKTSFQVMQCLSELMKSCWSHHPSQRPSFDTIVQQLDTGYQKLLNT